jgi:hypothetical protein
MNRKVSKEGASSFGALEYWSVGVLVKAKPEFQIELVFSITPLLHQSITPVLQVLLTTTFDKERVTAVYQRR